MKLVIVGVLHGPAAHGDDSEKRDKRSDKQEAKIILTSFGGLSITNPNAKTISKTPSVENATTPLVVSAHGTSIKETRPKQTSPMNLKKFIA
jgi:hypothetical protein